MNDPVLDNTRRLNALERQVDNMLRLARVTKVDMARGRVDVEFEDLPLADIPIFVERSGEDSSVWMPSVGELGCIVSPSGDLANAFFLSSLYFEDFPIPESKETEFRRIFRDGTEIYIDSENSVYRLTVGSEPHGEMEIDKSKTEIRRDGGRISVKRGDNEIKIDGAETEISRNSGNNKIEIDNNQIQIRRLTGKVEIRVGTTVLEVTPTQIKGSIAGLGKLLVNAALVNVNGATFTGGATNLVASGPTVTYVPVPIP